MSWDRLVPDLTQELMRQKIQECISETLETNNQALVTDLGNFELATLEHWADITTKFAFKILRHAKALSLVMDQNKVDRTQVDDALAQLTSNGPINLNTLQGSRNK